MDEPKRYADTIGGLIEHENGRMCYIDDPAIVQALAIREACHETGLLDERGNLRRIIGTLPMTADGCLIALGGTVFVWYEGFFDELTGSSEPAEWVGETVNAIYQRPDGALIGTANFEVDPTDCFSTNSAAERAAKGGTDGH